MEEEEREVRSLPVLAGEGEGRLGGIGQSGCVCQTDVPSR